MTRSPNRWMSRIALLAVATACASPPTAGSDSLTPTSKMIGPASASVVLGGSFQLQISARNATGTEVPAEGVTWTSSNPTTATVSASGLVNGVTTGSTTITARRGAVSGVIEVTVVVPPGSQQRLQLSTTALSLAIGSSVTINASLYDAAGVVSSHPVTWISSNAAVAAVAANGKVSALAAGTTMISATADGLTASVSVTVTTSRVASILIVGAAPEMVGGTSATLRAVLVDSLGNAGLDGPVTWSSNRSGVVSITAAGVATASDYGSAVITVKSGTITATTTIRTRVATVTIDPLAQFQALSGGIPALGVGAQLQLRGLAMGRSGNAMSSAPVATWTSDNPGVISVAANGLLSAIAPGTTTVRATIDGQTTVSPPIRVEAGIPLFASVRFVNAAFGADDLMLTPRSGQGFALGYGEQSTINLATGITQITANRHLTTGDPFSEVFQSSEPKTVVALGDGVSTGLVSVSDLHKAIAPDEVLVRVIHASSYFLSYNGNNLYTVAPGAILGQVAPIDFDFEIGSSTGFLSRPAGSFDIVVEDAGHYGTGGIVLHDGYQLGRFTVSPELGKATTYVLTGTNASNLHLIVLVNP